MTRRPDRDSLRDDYNLVAALEVAVAFRILELLAMSRGVRADHVRWWASDAADTVAHKGDMLLFRSKRSGRAAEVFNALAKGLAVGALQPGGVTFAGRHWQVENPDLDPPAKPGRTAPQQRSVTDVELPAEVTDAGR